MDCYNSLSYEELKIKIERQEKIVYFSERIKDSEAFLQQATRLKAQLILMKERLEEIKPKRTKKKKSSK